MNNNLGFVRVFAACMVMYSHGYALNGLAEPALLSWTPVGPLALLSFFCISGYLIAQSWDADPHLLRYLARRSLRIFPALAVCVLLTVLVLGPLMTTWPLGRYFASAETLGYLRNIVLYMSFRLPGVFTDNPFTDAVNGSLWSLTPEFILYLVVAATGLLFRSSRHVYLGLLVICAAVCLLWPVPGGAQVVVYATDAGLVFLMGIYFFSGACIFRYRLNRFFSLPALLLAIALQLCLEPWPAVARLASWVLLPWIVLSIGLALSPPLSRLVKSGDYSYGLYIYASPVQQVIVQLFPQAGFLVNQAATWSITLGLAILSWHWVEKPMLGLKPANPQPT